MNARKRTLCFRLSAFLLVLSACHLTAAVTFAAAPANDNFGTPTLISGTSGTLSASNVFATAETGEPDHGGDGLGAHASIWFKWTAPANGVFLFDTFGSSFDTVLSAYTGTAVDSLTLVEKNDDANQTSQSQIEFTAQAGTTYYIAVDGYDDAETGSVELNYGKKFPWPTFLPAITGKSRP